MTEVELLKIIISTQLSPLPSPSHSSSCSFASPSLSLSTSCSPLLFSRSLSVVECAQLVGTHVNCDLKPFYLRFIPFHFVLPPFALCSVREPVQVHWFAQFACCAFDFAFKTAAQKKIIQKCTK